jgi:TatA/E family protein of Tat protein translocase
MFDLGIQELIVIFVVALLVFGPKRLPELGRTLGKAMGDLRRAMHGVKEQVDAEMRDLKYPVSVDPRVIPTTDKPKEPEAYSANSAAAAEPSSGVGGAALQPESQQEQTPHKNVEGSSEVGKG